MAEELVSKIKKVTKTNLLKSIEDVLKNLDPTTLKKLSECEGFDKVLQDMTQHWNKFKGGKFQLEYAAKLIESGKKIKFEFNNLSDLQRRIYDITYDVVENGRTVVKKLELKNWNNFYPESIRNQFIKDLKTIENFDEIEWIFNKTDNIGDISTLKSKIIPALKNADGSALKAIDEIPLEKIKKLLGDKFGDVDRFNKSEKLLEALNENSIFEKIFKIAE